MKLVVVSVVGLVLGGGCAEPDGSVGRADSAPVDGAAAPDAAAADVSRVEDDASEAGGDRRDGGPACVGACERATDCGPSGWQCVHVAVAECAAPVGRCRHDCRRYRSDPATDELCCDGATRVEMECTEDRGWHCPEGSTQHTPASTGAFSATLFSCGPLAAEPEVGVACGSSGADASCVLPLSCCFTITNICDAGERACYARHACDGPEDCETGVCCGAPSRSFEDLGWSAANPLSTRCTDASECAAPNVRLCNGDEDCPPRERCCAERHDGRIGLCAADCPGG